MVYPDPVIQQKSMQRMEGMRVGGDLVDEEWEITRAGGQKRWLNITTSILSDENNIIHIMGLMRDITENKQFEKELQDSEKHFRDLAEMLPEVVFETDMNVNLTYANKRAFSLFGYTYEDFNNGLNGLDLIDHEDRERAKENVTKRFKGEMKGPVEYQALRKDGSTFPIFMHVSPITQQGNTIGLRGIIIDTTALKRTEDALQESYDRFRILFENAPIPYQSLDENGLIIQVNQTWLNHLGYTEDEVIGKSIEDFLPAGRKKHFKENFPRFMIKGEILGVDLELLKKDGSTVLMSVNGKVAKNPDGSFKQTHCVLHDITEHRKLEEQLRQSQKMEAVGTMAGGIAHDFNNILTIIAGNAGMALDDIKDDSPARKCIEKIFQASIRATDLVSQILAFSRKEKKELITIRPQVLIKETLKFLRSTTPTTISIVQIISNDCSKVLADPTGLHQVTMNLFSNAVHALDEKGEIIVKLQEVDLDSDDLKKFPHIISSSFKTPGKYARLSVTDEGSGIDEKTLKRIFDPFFTTKEVGKGTGMGLSVVHGIVDSHSGFMTVESEPGQGSTFSVFIPVTEVEKNELLETETVAAPLTGTERILVIDDEEALLELAGRILKSLGYAVTAESSSIEALELFRTDPDQFDLVITDQSMPNMSGTEVITEVLKIKPDLPCILCTGFSSKISEENARERGISKYLKKPYSKKILSEAVREVLNGKT
jgi:PAS domain S-box-containing protein